MSRILLVNYLLVVLHIGITHCHFSELCQGEKTHKHDNCESINHEHGFHGGIFHILEHLFEDVEHLDHQNHDHIVSHHGPMLKLSNSDLNLFDYFAFKSGSDKFQLTCSNCRTEANISLTPRGYTIYFQSRGPPTIS